MPLDPQAATFLEQLKAIGNPALHTLSPPEARRAYDLLSTTAAGEALPRIENHGVATPEGEIPVRLYYPTEERSLTPAVVYFHGGGWVLGSIESHDHIARALAKGTGFVVASVDYRLAPEHKFPAAFEDCFAVTHWLSEQASSLGADPARIAVAGDSAGGNLAAAVAQAARDRGGPRLAFQLLIYPVIDHRFDTTSYQDNADGYFLTRDGMRWFWNHYLPSPASGDDPLASPLRAGSLAGLPPALVLTAEFDPLRDEGEAYAERLQRAGVECRRRRHDGQIHGFFGMNGVLAAAQSAQAEACAALREALGHD